MQNVEKYCDAFNIECETQEIVTKDGKMINITRAEKNWNDLVDTGVLNRNTTLVGHSLSTLAAPKLIGDNKTKLGKCIFVAGPARCLRKNFLNPARSVKNWVMEPFLKEWYGYNLTELDLQRASVLVKERHIFASKGDKYFNIKEMRECANWFAAKYYELEGLKHFQSTAKNGQQITVIPGLIDKL